jgi:adenylate cyclase, class 2
LSFGESLMGTEIEAKMKVADLESVRRKLPGAGAVRSGSELETNTFYDTRDAALQSADRGLRIRVAVRENGESRTTITLKGALQPGQLKKREEIEFSVSDSQSAGLFLERLGYLPTLAFEKRRETWRLGECEIALDELPKLGTFVEIEGPDEEEILEVRQSLGLANLPLISRGYISLLWQWVQDQQISDRMLRL